MLKQKNAINGGQNWEYNLNWLFGYTLSQSIGRGRISRVGSIVLNETVIVEIGVIKFCANPPRNFGLKFKYVLAQ